MFTVTTLDGDKIPVALCSRCNEQFFSKESWQKLLGLHPETSAHDHSGDACFDGEFSYTIQTLGGARHPHNRGPILRCKVSVKDLIEEAACGFCKIVKDLDVDQDLATGKYEHQAVDLQLFSPNWCNGIWLPFVLQVSLVLGAAKEETKVKRTILTLTTERCRLLVDLRDQVALTSFSQGPYYTNFSTD